MRLLIEQAFLCIITMYTCFRGLGINDPRHRHEYGCRKTFRHITHDIEGILLACSHMAGRCIASLRSKSVKGVLTMKVARWGIIVS